MSLGQQNVTLYGHNATLIIMSLGWRVAVQHATLVGLSLGRQMYIPCGDHTTLLGIGLVRHGAVLWNHHSTIVNRCLGRNVALFYLPVPQVLIQILSNMVNPSCT